MQYAKSSLYDQVRDFLLTGELYEVTATSGANLRKSRGSREPRGSKLLFPEADPCLFAVGARSWIETIGNNAKHILPLSGLARALWLKIPSYVKWP